MDNTNMDYVTTEASTNEGVTKRRLFAGIAATLAASAISAAAKPGPASAMEQISLGAVWREHRRRVDAINEWARENPGQDVSTETMDWADDILFEAGNIAPRSEADWAALVLIALTLRPYYDSGDVLDEIEERCCAFGLPSMESRL